MAATQMVNSYAQQDAGLGGPVIFSSLELPFFCLPFTENRQSTSEDSWDWHLANQNSQLETFQVQEVHSCQDALDYNTGRATDRQMLLLQLHQALSSKRSVLFSLRQCGNLVFASCLMKPKCWEISSFFPSFSLNFSNLSLCVDMKPRQNKEGLPCHITTAKPPSTPTWPLLLFLSVEDSTTRKHLPQTHFCLQLLTCGFIYTFYAPVFTVRKVHLLGMKCHQLIKLRITALCCRFWRGKSGIFQSVSLLSSVYVLVA